MFGYVIYVFGYMLSGMWPVIGALRSVISRLSRQNKHKNPQFRNIQNRAQLDTFLPRSGLGCSRIPFVSQCMTHISHTSVIQPVTMSIFRSGSPQCHSDPTRVLMMLMCVGQDLLQKAKRALAASCSIS